MSQTMEITESLTSEYVLLRLDQSNENGPIEAIGIYHTEEEAYAEGLMNQMQAIEENTKNKSKDLVQLKHDAVLELCRYLKDELTNYKERFEYLSNTELFSDIHGVTYKVLLAKTSNAQEMSESVFKTRVRNFQDAFQSELADDEEDLGESNDEDDEEEEEEEEEEEDIEEEEEEEEVDMDERENDHEEEVQDEDEDIDEVEEEEEVELEEEDLDDEEVDEEEDIAEEEEDEPSEGAVPETNDSEDERPSQKRSRSQSQEDDDDEEDEIEEDGEEEEDGDEDELEEEEETSNKKQRVTA